MEQRTWRWTDAHFCSLPSQTNIYGCTKLVNHVNGTNKLLVASLLGKFFTIDYQRVFEKLTPSTKEVQFTYIPGESEIVSVDATNKCAHGYGLTIGITFWKIEDNESKHFLHIYYASQSGEEFNLESVAQGCQSFELMFVPYHLTHTDLVTENGTEPVFMLSGSDSRIHMYQEVNELHSFQEVECEDDFPELRDLPSVVLWLDIVYYNNNRKRITSCGFLLGGLAVWVVDVATREIESQHFLDFDNPITYVKAFSLHNEVDKPAFISSQEDDCAEVDSSPSRSSAVPQLHILVLSALLPATIFRDVLVEGLQEPVYLPDSNKFDAVLTGCIIDIDFDGENEILIGTYGQEVLAYKIDCSRRNRVYKVSSASDTETEDLSPVHNVKDPNDPTHPKIQDKVSRRVKSQENLASSLASDTDYIPLSSSKDTVISVQRRDKLMLEDLDAVECRLLWQRSFPCPVIGINRLDIMGDGMEDLVIITLKGIHILQPDLNEVANVCLDRLQLLADDVDDGFVFDDVDDPAEADASCPQTHEHIDKTTSQHLACDVDKDNSQHVSQDHVETETSRLESLSVKSDDKTTETVAGRRVPETQGNIEMGTGAISNHGTENSAADTSKPET